MNVVLCYQSVVQGKQAILSIESLYTFGLKHELFSSTVIQAGAQFSLDYFKLRGFFPSRGEVEAQIGQVIDEPDREYTEAELYPRVARLLFSLRDKQYKKVLMIAATSQTAEERLSFCYQAAGILQDASFDAVKYESSKESFYIHEMLEERKGQAAGVLTGIPDLDAILKGVTLGTLMTVFAAPGSFKTTLAISMAYYNATFLNYRVVYVTLEVPKQHIYFSILSRHSYSGKFGEAIPAEDIKKSERLTSEQRKQLIEVEADWKQSCAGDLLILDLSDSIDFHPERFGLWLEQLYEKFPFDFFIIDYLQLLRFLSVKGYTDYELMNKVLASLREKAVCINGGKNFAALALSQANREGVKRVSKVKTKGRYNLMDSAEINEIERASYYIVSLFSDDVMKKSNELTWQLLKHRGGETREDPQACFVEPAYFVVGETEEYKTMMSEDTFGMMAAGGFDDVLF